VSREKKGEGCGQETNINANDVIKKEKIDPKARLLRRRGGGGGTNLHLEES